jgi:radical SAM superfamily enzyme YgiQ (UPF0313 family)
VIFGGIHATLYPEEALEPGGAHAVVKGDGDMVWAKALADCREGAPKPVYAGGQIEASDFVAARWDRVPRNRYMGASVPGMQIPALLPTMRVSRSLGDGLGG